MRPAAAIGTAALILASALPAFGGDRLGVGVKAGTLGIGVDVTGKITERLSVRGTLNQADASFSPTISGIDYDATLTLGGYGVLVDFHPFKGSLRLSAGWLHNRTGVDFSARPRGSITIGNGSYGASEVGTLRGGVDARSSVPYFGIGFGNAAKSPGRLRFLMDLGFLSQGSGHATLSSSRNVVNGADLRNEASQIDDKIDTYRYWPVLAFGISCRI